MNVNASVSLPLVTAYRSLVRLAQGGLCIYLSLALLACGASGQIQMDLEHQPISLGSTDLEVYGIGFLTPAAATGQETDKQSLSLVFSNELSEMRPGIHVVALPEVLSQVNRNDLAEQYQEMYRDYLETGILDRELLRKIADATNVRYLAQLSLADFRQIQRGRFSLLGLRIVDTQIGNMRVFLQIWDGYTGTVAWEGTLEVNYAYDTSKEKPVTFQQIAELASRRLFSELPGSTAQENNE